MKFSLAVLLFGATALAIPTGGGSGGDGGDGGSGTGYQPCTSTLFSDAQCCSTDVLGVVGLDCANRESSPHRADNARTVRNPES